MSFKVLVVDDSTFFRRRVTEILNQDPLLEVIGEARDGQDAIEKVTRLKPDVVTMDVEMPVMDGITSVRNIMKTTPVPILMFSSLTTDGAQSTFDAMEAGALDFIPKKFEDIVSNRKEAIELLQQRVKAIARRKGSLARAFAGKHEAPKPMIAKPMFYGESAKKTPETKSLATGRLSSRSGKKYRVLAIGSSTGGPIALQQILTELPAGFSLPIIIVQHMPGSFTKAFAERLNNLCQISVKEAETGDVLKPGHAYVAPGGRQMFLEESGRSVRVSISDAPEGSKVTYKPSVDLTFNTVADIYKSEALGLILTGMGADGREGCRKMHQRGARIWAQDEKSSVVYGMPQAVTRANLAEANYALDDIAANVLTEMG
ncbi:chemotaxis response regulator protein-glutamate methylesterase [Alteromonadaceae bacterium M269]|nr:chemotaxis response regulator protein-glutamate methylesterase [Alteromonadaceae bacterium M269]